MWSYLNCKVLPDTGYGVHALALSDIRGHKNLERLCQQTPLEHKLSMHTVYKYCFYLGICRWQGHFTHASVPPEFSWALAFSRLLRVYDMVLFFYPVVFLFKAEQVRPLRGTVEQGIYQSSVPEDSNHFICSRTGIWCWWLLLSPAFFILMGSSMSRAEHFPRQVIQLFAWRNLTLPQTV